MRQFLAIGLPASTRERVGRAQARMREECRGWRWVHADSMHLTVRFFGRVPEQSDGPLRERWREAARSSDGFVLRLGDVGRFPSAGRPRVLWLGIVEDPPGGRLSRLVETVERSAREAGFPAEERAFHPHLTLARAERGGRPTEPQPIGFKDEEPIRVAELVLFRSELGRHGARYTVLDTFPLLGGKHDADGT